MKVDRNTVRKWARNDNGDIAVATKLGRQTKITPKTRVRYLAMNKVTGIRSLVKKLHFSENFRGRNKKVGVTTVRRNV